ncbi:hypothetical protein SCALM49S_04327 [Streptomyces californicus]
MGDNGAGHSPPSPRCSPECTGADAGPLRFGGRAAPVPVPRCRPAARHRDGVPGTSPCAIEPERGGVPVPRPGDAAGCGPTTGGRGHRCCSGASCVGRSCTAEVTPRCARPAVGASPAVQRHDPWRSRRSLPGSISTVIILEEPTAVRGDTADADGDGVFDGDTAGTADHRYGCSGIGGLAFGPDLEGRGGSRLTVAYGVYANTARTDNDHQVLLRYDVRDWARYERPLGGRARRTSSGPRSPDGKFFVVHRQHPVRGAEPGVRRVQRQLAGGGLRGGGTAALPQTDPPRGGGRVEAGAAGAWSARAAAAGLPAGASPRCQARSARARPVVGSGARRRARRCTPRPSAADASRRGAVGVRAARACWTGSWSTGSWWEALRARTAAAVSVTTVVCSRAFSSAGIRARVRPAATAGSRPAL